MNAKLNTGTACIMVKLTKSHPIIDIQLDYANIPSL